MATNTLLAAKKRFQLASLAAQALAAHGNEIKAEAAMNPGGGPTPPRPAMGALPNTGGKKHAPFRSLPGFGERGMGAAATPALLNTGGPKQAPFSSAGVHQGALGVGATMTPGNPHMRGGPAGGKPIAAPPSARLEALAALLGQDVASSAPRRRRRRPVGVHGGGGPY